MVATRRHHRGFWLGIVSSGWLAMLAAVAGADVYTTVDRSSVQVNESFSLTLVADGNEVGEPVIDGLDEHFDILGRSQSSNVTIVNGQRKASRRWTYVLLPKAAGEFVVPPLSVGGVESEPLPVLVRAAAIVPPGQADVFLEVSLDRERSWVQAQVVYTLKLYLGVAVRQTSLDDPQVDGGDVIVERLAEDRRYETQIDDRIYTVVERNFALYPQASGDYTISPVRFQASLWERGRISTPRVFRSEALTLTVDPVVAPPPDIAGAAWLPASDVRLRAEVRPDDGILDAGEPANVRIRLEAEGLLASQLPDIELPDQPGLRIYPDQPDLETRALPETMRSAREQSFAVIASRGGVFDLPEFSVPWFDTTEGQWRRATVALPSLRAAGVVTSGAADVAPATETATADAGAATDTPADSAAPADPAAMLAMRERLFRLKTINYGLLALWLATLAWVWRGVRRTRKSRRRARRKRDAEAPFRAQHKAMKAVQRACDAGDARATAAALVRWAQRFFPQRRINSLGDVASAMPAAQAAAVEALSRHLYGRDGSGWEPTAIKTALRDMHTPGKAEALARGEELPPLFPAA